MSAISLPELLRKENTKTNENGLSIYSFQQTNSSSSRHCLMLHILKLNIERKQLNRLLYMQSRFRKDHKLYEEFIELEKQRITNEVMQAEIKLR